jgi:hypothetical protein
MIRRIFRKGRVHLIDPKDEHECGHCFRFFVWDGNMLGCTYCQFYFRTHVRLTNGEYVIKRGKDCVLAEAEYKRRFGDEERPEDPEILN